MPGARSQARYAGSLIQLDFGEREQDKSVVVVEATSGKPAKAEPIPITAGRKLIDVEGTFEQIGLRATDVGDAYLRVFVDTDGPVPGIADRVRELLPNAVDVHLRYERDEGGADGDPLSSLRPRDQFLAYFRASHGAEPGDALMAAFDELAEEEA